VIRVIKSDADYNDMLSQIEELVALDPAPGTPEAESLELLALVVRDYEEKRFPRRLPTPVDAIRFRMEQQGLTQKDLVPFFGSKSKVSEVLSGKRPLTLAMIRSLHTGLGIPADALLHDRTQIPVEDYEFDLDRFPVAEMARRGWLPSVRGTTGAPPTDALRRFFAPLGIKTVHALYRRTRHIRGSGTVDVYALMAWTSRVAIKSMERRESIAAYTRDAITAELMRELARLSWSNHGPILAQEFLARHGVALVIEPHLTRTHLDAAVFLLGNRPVVGLTLRHDRIDNFWFCLMHELAHLVLHLQSTDEDFYDDLDVESVSDVRESEADDLAGETLVPRQVWEQSPARHLRSVDAVEHLARHLKIHPAIVAGRIRHHSKNYRVLAQSLGQGQVRKLFADIRW
jgi:HTH-type transcriptional regulator/antitoxin HigA